MNESREFTKSGNKVSGIFGFDLGTTNSVVSAFSSDGTPEPLSIKDGAIIPSCVMFNSDGTYTIGKEAYRHKKEPNVVYSFKKFMGSKQPIKIDVSGKELTLTAKEISTIFVREVFKMVLEQNPQFKGISRVVVSVPAYFDVHQINDTKEAFTSLGYTVDFVQQEPTSAGLVFQTIKRIKDPILVFDLGGGTFDAVLMRNELGFPEESRAFYSKSNLTLPPSKDILEILEISGDNKLGGDDVDELAIANFNRFYNLSLPVRTLLPIAEFSKITMADSPVNVEGTIYQFKYDFVKEATLTVFERCIGIVDKMLSRKGVKKVHCVLCGGSTKSPIIREELQKRFECSIEIDPDLAVSVGNAMTARLLSKEESISVISVTAKHIGVIVDGRFTPIIRKGDIMPAMKKFYPRNASPFAQQIIIDFYQTEDLFGQLTKIASLTLDNVTGFDNNGFVSVPIEVVVTLDGIIEVAVSNAGRKITKTLTVGGSAPGGNDEAESKAYRRFKAAIEKSSAEHILPLLEQFKQNETKEIAQEINKALVEWRELNG